MKKLVMIVFVMMLILTACSGGESESVSGTWSLVSYGDPANQTSAAPDVDTSIEFKDGQMSGNVGCNGFGGKYEVDGDTIKFSDVVSTLMFCEGPIGDQETTALNVLRENATFVLDGNQVTIKSADGSAAIVLARK